VTVREPVNVPDVVILVEGGIVQYVALDIKNVDDAHVLVVDKDRRSETLFFPSWPALLSLCDLAEEDGETCAFVEATCREAEGEAL
jgi:hypothetical protein